MPNFRGSWYSQLPAFGWFDAGDRPNSNALGVPDARQGIALPSRSTLGKYFNVTAPNGQTLRLQQTDVGPAKWTGRGVDISAAAGQQFGYTPKNFPTDAQFKVESEDGSEIPANARQTSGTMPGLMDLYNQQNQQPTLQSGWNNLTSGGMSNSLIGLGMGMLQPYRPWAGESPWTNALQGMMVGQRADQSSAGQRQNMALQLADRQWREQEAARAQSNADRQFSLQQQQFDRGNITDAQKAFRDIYGDQGTPEQKQEFFKQWYMPKTEGDWSLQTDDNTGDKFWVNKRTMETRPFQLPSSSGGGGATTPVVPGTTLYWPDQQQGAAPSQTLARPKAFEPEQKLRKEFDDTNKMFTTVREGYNRLLASKDDAAGDIALIFGYMRMLDPGSVVREGEFATAQNAAGVPDMIRNMYNRALSGERLNPQQREQFKGQAGAIYDRYDKDYQARAEQYRNIARQYRLDPERVITRFEPPDRTPQPPSAATTGTGKSAAPPASTAAPARPSNVPAGSAYSPSRNQWRAPNGQIYDASGKAL